MYLHTRFGVVEVAHMSASSQQFVFILTEYLFPLNMNQTHPLVQKQENVLNMYSEQRLSIGHTSYLVENINTVNREVKLIRH
jgi:hypothetical protein